MSPTQRTLAELRDRRLVKTVWIVEHWNSFAHIRQDLFGFVDVLALVRPLGNTKHQTWAIQTTTTGVAERIAKIRANPHYENCLNAGWRIFVWGWRKLKVKRGGKAVKWTLREIEITPNGEIEEAHDPVS